MVLTQNLESTVSKSSLTGTAPAEIPYSSKYLPIQGHQGSLIKQYSAMDHGCQKTW